MRVSVVLAAVATVVWCAPASAQSIVQNVTGTQRQGQELQLFDPTLGVLDSVQIEGTTGLDEGIVRGNTLDFSAVSVPLSSTGLLTLNYGPVFFSTTITGYETYDEGSIFGGIGLSGPVSTILTGGDVSQFIAGAYTSEIFEPITGPLFPTIGEIEYGPGNVSTYSLKVTYNYHNYLPEPSTWAMMLLGLGLVATAARQRRVAA